MRWIENHTPGGDLDLTLPDAGKKTDILLQAYVLVVILYQLIS